MSRSIAGGVIIVALCLVFVIVTTCCKTRQNNTSQSKVVEAAPLATERRSLWSEAEEEEIVEKIKTKLQPLEFDFVNGTQKLSPHQFLHLHHMKTGGTSMDDLIKCGMGRLKRIRQWNVPYYTIHECQETAFKTCLEDETNSCRGNMDNAAVMSFCAPIKHLDTFGWTEDNIKALTVLRHPVNRVWSMFRFQTKQCYRCMNLTDIYDMIDNDDVDWWPEDALCLKQLQNHQVVNMLRKDFPKDATEDEMVEEAINNMKNFFSVIGLTERLQETYEVVGQVFPWLQFKIEGSGQVCRLPHSNKSPDNNGCIEDPNGGRGTHWAIPDEPDEITRKAIEEHNRMDIKLYEAASQYFELQMRVANMGEES